MGTILTKIGQNKGKAIEYKSCFYFVVCTIEEIIPKYTQILALNGHVDRNPNYYYYLQLTRS